MKLIKDCWDLMEQFLLRVLRPNLSFQVKSKVNWKNKIIDLLNQHKGESSLDTEKVSEFLNQNGFTSSLSCRLK